MATPIPSSTPLSLVPAGRPPSGVEPLNFVNPQTLESTLITVSAITIALATFFVTARIYLNKANKTHKLGWDDAFCVLGLILSTAVVGVEISLKKFARHFWDIPVSWFDASYHKRDYAAQILVAPAQFFTKVSLLMLYLRLFSTKSRTRRVLYCAIAFAFCLYWVSIPVTTYFCTPRAGSPWGVDVGEKCSKIIMLGVVQGSMNVALDIFILAVPIPIVVKLKISRRRKLGVLAVFMTGLFTIIASVVGLAYRAMGYQHRSGDATWNSSNTTICVIVETNVSLVCSSMPAFASLSKHYPFSWSYLSGLRGRLLNALHLSNTAKISKRRGLQADKKTSAANHSTNWYGVNGSQSPARSSTTMIYEHFAPEQSPTIEVRSSPSHYDVELGEIQRLASLQQLVTKTA